MSIGLHITPFSTSMGDVGSFLSRILLWLRLGSRGGRSISKRQLIRSERFDMSRHQARAEAHRGRRTGYKPPAHNLEVLMCFAPNASGGPMTLNQYRERFTRISSLGRFQIYYWFYYRREHWREGAVRRRDVLGQYTPRCERVCAAPLWPN